MAADQEYCSAYARGAALATVGQPLTYPRLMDVRERFYLRCLNAEEGVDEADSVWAQDVVNSAIGTVPATDKPSPTSRAEKSTSLLPAQVCAKAHRKIVWQGKSWRCVQ